MEARQFAQARAEYRTLAERASGVERDTARVRLGAVDYLAGKSPTAAVYLRPLEVAAPEAEAERLYYLVECARRVDDDGELHRALKGLEGQSPKSPWRLKALVAGGNYFLVSNRADEYLPLYRGVYQDFPDGGRSQPLEGDLRRLPAPAERGGSASAGTVGPLSPQWQRGRGAVLSGPRGRRPEGLPGGGGLLPPSGEAV